MSETELKYRVKVEQTSPNFWVTDDDCIYFPFHDSDDAFDLARMLNDTSEIEALKAETIEAEGAVADLMELNDNMRDALEQISMTADFCSMNRVRSFAKQSIK